MSDLSSKLSKLSTLNPHSDVDNIPVIPLMKTESIIPKDNKKEKRSIGQRITSITSDIEDSVNDTFVDDIDLILDDIFDEDDDDELRNNLINLGRKYARENRGSDDSVANEFSKQESVLHNLLKEVVKDSNDIQKDIILMRSRRAQNSKTMAELLSAKSQYHNTTLSIVKEMTNIRKAIHDIKNKSKKEDTTDTSMAAASALQSLFGAGPESLMSSVGGRTSVSGGDFYDPSYDSDDYSDYSDEEIIAKYEEEEANNNSNKANTDAFLKYENVNVKYILELDPNTNTKTIYAEDSDGNILEDYPLPNVSSKTNFDIRDDVRIATDPFQNSYQVRYTTERDYR